MKPTIIARHKRELIDLVEEEVEKNSNCDLNHIDVSQIKDMSYLFRNSKFNGDISKWDVSNVKNMEQMFAGSEFNGDVSKWNVSKVINMELLFKSSKFTGDISDWKPYIVETLNNAFKDSNVNIPYWAQFQDKETRNKVIDAYWLKKELEKDLGQELKINDNSSKRPKI
jgi:surface protein